MTEPDTQGGGGKHWLPDWVALRGPKPYWLVEHWSLIVALLTGITVFVNTVIFPNLPSAAVSEWINAAMAWISAIALYLKGREASIAKVAAWREQMRAQNSQDKPTE
jgi:hypothetical protein